ncbi:hypothetical protein BDR03DRAFT_1013391 [Suillus americanus]|nr:hypothetical protein BDR03DRAFT_1013391 [Suillus americanus]
MLIVVTVKLIVIIKLVITIVELIITINVLIITISIYYINTHYLDHSFCTATTLCQTVFALLPPFHNGDLNSATPYLPTEDQLKAMDKFIDSMDIMDSREKDDKGNPVSCTTPLSIALPASMSPDVDPGHADTLGCITGST